MAARNKEAAGAFGTSGVGSYMPIALHECVFVDIKRVRETESERRGITMIASSAAAWQ
jgi:hypothetical protein